MDLQSFIRSGLLEAYVLGQCSAEERALVERMVAGHAELRAELTAIEKALEGYAAAGAETPPVWMKGRILELIENEATARTPKTPSAAPSVPSFQALRLFQWLALGLALLCGFFFFQKNKTDSENRTLETRAAELQRQIDDCKGREGQADTLRQVNLLLRDRSDTRTVPLSNGENGKFTGYAYHNTARCEVAVDLNSLPAPAPGKHFQLWSVVDGKPVSMGMVRLQAAGGWLLFPCQPNAALLAISQEDNPNGNPAPTEVLLSGVIPPAG